MPGGWHARTDRAHARRHSTERRRAIWGVLGVGLLCCALLSVFVLRGVGIIRLRRERATCEEELFEVLSEQAMLERRLAEKDNLSVVEYEARRQLGWILPGEIRVVFVAPTSRMTEEE